MSSSRSRSRHRIQRSRSRSFSRRSKSIERFAGNLFYSRFVCHSQRFSIIRTDLKPLVTHSILLLHRWDRFKRLFNVIAVIIDFVCFVLSTYWAYQLMCYIYFYSLRSDWSINFQEEGDEEEGAQGYTRQEKVCAEKYAPLAILQTGRKQPWGYSKSCLQEVRNFCQEGRWLAVFDEGSSRKVPPWPEQGVPHDGDKGQPWKGKIDAITFNIHKA